MAQPMEMTLATIGNGELIELATAELRRICANIADPNMPKDAKRKMVITVEIKPDAKGQTTAITYSVKSGMPSPLPGKTMAHVAFDPESGAISLFEVESHPPLFEPQQPLPNVTTLPAAKQA